MQVPFNKPYTPPGTIENIKTVIDTVNLAGNGLYTHKCHSFFINRYKLKACFLTTSCTDALEMASMLIDIKHGDEVIIPSFTFVSTALAFHRQGAIIRFVDSGKDNPCMDVDQIEPLINSKTKAIVPVHYLGMACDMERIMMIAMKHGLYVVEDAAHAIESSYKGHQLGTIGHLGCFSFHETKAIQCGEGGLLAVNDESMIERAELIWEKGTNRSEFLRGKADFYEWKDNGSSFLPSELNAAYLYGQLLCIDKIYGKRLEIVKQYKEGLKELRGIGKIIIPSFDGQLPFNDNGFYFLCRNYEEKTELISYLEKLGIICKSHYLPLHLSRYYYSKHDGRILPNCISYSDRIVRLPLFNDLKKEEALGIIATIISFYSGK